MAHFFGQLRVIIGRYSAADAWNTLTANY